MSAAHRARRAFTLIEAVVVVVVLTISVPPTVAWLNQSAGRRADAVNTIRATTLSTCVLEQILADASSTSPGRGFAAFANAATYLNTPTTGLRARITSQTQPYQTLGITYAVTIGPLVDRTGVVNPTPANNIFRRITVSVTFPRSDGPSAAIAVETMVTQL